MKISNFAIRISNCKDAPPQLDDRVIAEILRSEMATPRLRADFNGLFGDLLCLSHDDSCQDENGTDVTLSAGMSVIAFDLDAEDGKPDNLIASGIVEQSPDWLLCRGSKWVLRIDSNGVRHESEISEDAEQIVGSLSHCPEVER